MSDLVGNPEDRFSRVAALINIHVEHPDFLADTCSILALRKLAHAIYIDFLSFEN